MGAELAKKKEIVAQKAKDCNDLLLFLFNERRVADEQKSKVELDSQRIAKEEIICKEIADDAEVRCLLLLLNRGDADGDCR